MVRAIVLYDEEPDAEWYARHVDLCRQVPGATFRSGPVFGAPMGEPAMPFVREAARQDPSPKVRDRAAELLGSGGARGGRGWPARSSGGSMFKR